MGKPYPPVSYANYLKISELLSLQKKRSEEFGVEAHDELLFIIVHQAYELWFKQILAEIDSVLKTFRTQNVDEKDMGSAVHRLERIVEIQKLLVSHIDVLETMTALDFLDFRDLLYPASGFQSVQNRLIENKLGLKSETRVTYNSQTYHAALTPAETELLIQSESEPSLFDCVDQWLSRTPFLNSRGFNFWEHYRKAVTAVFSEERDVVSRHQFASPTDRERNLKEIEMNEETFQSLFDAAKYEKLREQGMFRLSYQALHAALLIQLYRDQPVLNLPFRVLAALQNIDEQMSTWRSRHAIMAHRMIGRRIGTGGSSGAQYLRTATEKHRIFGDFFNLTTFLIPRSRLPDLPEEMRKELGFYYSA